MEKERSIAIQFCILIFVLAGIGIEIGYSSHTPSCTIGVPGTQAKVTFQSNTAPDDCRKLVNSGNFSAVTETIHEPAICGENGFFSRYTVYAQGMFDREGETLCRTLPVLLGSGCSLDDPQSTHWAITPLNPNEDVLQEPVPVVCRRASELVPI